MSIEIQPEVADFIRAQNAHNTDAAVACFAEDAVVYDEGEDKELRGEAIREWADMVNSEYKIDNEVTAAIINGDEAALTVLASGTFPGSPLVFQHNFSLRDGKIVRLAIKLKP